MNFFRVSDTQTTSDIIDEFRGLNLTEKKLRGELAVCENVSCDYFPFLKNRTPDFKLKEEGGNITSLIMCDKLFECVEKGSVTKAYYGGAETSLSMSTGKKRLVRMGSRVIIFPDKLWYDVKSGESASLEAFFASAEGVSAYAEVCDIDGASLDAVFSAIAPDAPADGSYWCDTSVYPYVMKVSVGASWNEVSSVYTKIKCPGIGVNFKAGDGVAIYIDDEFLSDGYFVLETVSEDFLVVPSIFDVSDVSGSIRVERRLPVTDFEVECQNRIWACRWGLDKNGNFVNEIYASKLGDPTNFDCYEGLSSDSYTVSLGSEGAFTGAASYLGNVIFFKERTLHKVFGSRPADFSVVTVDTLGVKEGCEGSLVLADDLLYYVSRDGVTVYDGAFPKVISEKLTPLSMSNVSAAQCSGKLYFSGEFDTVLRTFVLDTDKYLWSERDFIPISAASSVGDALFYASENTLGLVCEKSERIPFCEAACAGCAEISDSVSWCFETGNLSGTLAEYVYKVALRVKVAKGATFAVSAQYFTDGPFESVGTLTPSVERSYTIPIQTRRSDSFRLRFEGHGDFILYSVARFSDAGYSNLPLRF